MKGSKKEAKKDTKIILSAPRGMHDILPSERPWWDKIEAKAKELAEFYGFSRIETPVLESAHLFIRGTGENTDVVKKEMYTLRTKGGDFLALRPEGTPAVMRAYIEHGFVSAPQPVKLYYFYPVFRHDRPQAGRYRQFYQFGLETIGEEQPIADVEIIYLSWLFLNEVGLSNAHFEINSLGCRRCRSNLRQTVKKYYERRRNKLCPDCRRRLETNPLRILDCKNESCIKLKEDLPPLIDKVCDDCRSHFEQVLEYLEELGVPYNLNSTLVRGLDYYTRTVFEIWLGDNESMALGGGGRYDEMLQELGGPKKPAVGVALGIERIIEELKEEGHKPPTPSRPRVYLVQLGEMAKKKAFKIMEDFRKHNIKLGSSLGRDNLRAQLKNADRLGVDFSLILGQEEVLNETIILRDMRSGLQETIPLGKIVEEIKKRLH